MEPMFRIESEGIYEDGMPATKYRIYKGDDLVAQGVECASEETILMWYLESQCDCC